MEPNKNIKILITDDEPKSLFTLEMLLSQEPYEILFAQTGQAAIDMVKTEAPDLILMDVMMPDMTGFEVCQNLKADVRFQHIPIILVTALNRREDLVHGLDTGADEFITKPVQGIELRARVRSMLRLKRQYDQLQETMDLRETMSNIIMHDIRNPISTLMLYANLLEYYQKQSKPTDEIIQKINYQAHRLNSYVGELYLLANVRSGKLFLQPKPVNVGQLLKIAVIANEVLAGYQGIKLNLVLPDKLPTFSLDERLMQLSIDSLITNALKFSPPDGTITLELFIIEKSDHSHDERPGFRIEIKDEGVGIPAEHHEKIFDKYGIIEVKKNKIPQLGLGLAICKKVVEAHFGRIFVRENHPTGTIFIIEI